MDCFTTICRIKNDNSENQSRQKIFAVHERNNLSLRRFHSFSSIFLEFSQALCQKGLPTTKVVCFQGVPKLPYGNFQTAAEIFLPMVLIPYTLSSTLCNSLQHHLHDLKYKHKKQNTIKCLQDIVAVFKLHFISPHFVDIVSQVLPVLFLLSPVQHQ